MAADPSGTMSYQTACSCSSHEDRSSFLCPGSWQAVRKPTAAPGTTAYFMTAYRPPWEAESLPSGPLSVVGQRAGYQVFGVGGWAKEQTSISSWLLLFSTQVRGLHRYTPFIMLCFCSTTNACMSTAPGWGGKWKGTGVRLCGLQHMQSFDRMLLLSWTLTISFSALGKFDSGYLDCKLEGLVFFKHLSAHPRVSLI